ncbi:MAG: EscR/YscR/HrcR family type III secretion system export apparatus protein [Pseudomonadota bacterium]
MEVSTPVIIGLIGSFFIIAVLTLTAYVKLSVVFLIVRNALGLQQVPSNMVVMALSLFLATFISMPVISASATAILESPVTVTTPQALLELWHLGIAPFQAFILKNTDPTQLDFFVSVTNEMWRGSGLSGTADDFIIQVPSFMITELTEAFEIGFLLYLPFVAIDLAVTGILMALGMQMVQPNIISVPFKLLVFVFVNGWAQMVQGLVLTYGGA